MKQKDIFTIVFVAVVSAVLSIIFSNMIFNKPENRSQQVEVIAPISSELVRPSQVYFNSKSINPTLTIEIGDSSTEQPFGSQ